MKIAMAHVDLPNETKGGVAAQAHHLANAMARRGHDVTMFTFSPAYAESEYQVHQIPLPAKFRKVGSFALAWHLSRLDFSGFDIVHTHGDNYLLNKTPPQIRTFHGSARDEAASAKSMKRKIYQRLMVRLEVAGARAADVNVGVSEATRSRIPEVEHIIPCGVDLSQFHPSDKSPHPTVLFVGTVGGRKRGSLLAEAFVKDIRSRIPNAELWSVAEAPLEGDGIVNMGRVSYDRLAELYRQAWVFCLPSTYEGFGVPYIEAMASGTCAVATPNPGANEVLAGGKYGIIAEDSELGKKIAELLTDDSLRNRFVVQGLERAKHYGWDNVTAQYEQLYDTAIAARTQGREPDKNRLAVGKKLEDSGS